jgi:pyruvate dehydrogenase E2 component (dihydrolipoamide acetyltransferase)
MTEITMPKLSDSMEDGTILSWLKQPGEEVQAGEDLVEIETDKATVTHPAQAAGVVLELLVAEGESVAVGVPIARVGVGAEGTAIPEPEPAPATSETPVGSSAVALPATAAAPVNGKRGGYRAGLATPLARRVAAAHDIALDDLEGTGPLGRITRDDVLARAGLAAAPPSLPATPTASAAAPAPVAAAAADPAPAPSGERPGTSRQEPTRLQQLIARRMAEAKATIPHFQVQTEVLMDATIALRRELKALADEQPVPSFNDIIIKAAAVALREHPLANGSYRDGGFELHEAINVGMAVAADDALVVPTVFDAGGKSLGQIARETRTLAARVRSGEITPPELSGGTFTVSNLGMFGMTAITPVINPPQAAILGVGAMREVLARVDGDVVDRTLLTLTLSCDHRILYGADAARFLARIRELLETPLKLAL